MNHFSTIRTQLEKRGLDAVLINSEANRFYASAFHTTGADDAVVLVTTKDSYLITDSRYTEAAEATLKDAKLVIRANAASYLDLIAQVFTEDGVKKAGFEDAALTVKEFNAYNSGLDCELLPASDLFLELRQSKDADEIRRLKAAQKIADEALTQLLEEIRPGMTELEISARLQYLMLLRGAERMSFDPIVAGGPNSSMPHAVPSNRKIQDGDFLTIDFGCVYEGYCSDTTRTVAIGHATDEMRRVYQTVLEAQLAGIAKAKTGVIGKVVHETAHDVIRSAGYGEYFGHGFGHSLGLEIHEPPYFNSRNEKPMPDCAAVSAEPGIYLPGKFGVRIEDVIILHEDGCEDITGLPKDLRII
ncbi:MAG: aminopeptidase P family protein [Oscillospiraceae bacterium]|nr:aminopeptidase P family protein [Oscillospiraceae bacterium]